MTDLYLDFDSTIANSEKAFCDVYNMLYKDKEGFVAADWKKVSNWSFIEQCPLIHQLHENPVQEGKRIFGTDEFFNALELYDNAFDVLTRLAEKYNLIVCTFAAPHNGSKKILWIEEHLPCVTETIVILNKMENGTGKKRVPMLEEDAIFVDDHPKNLHSTKASRKILYKYKETNYNQDWTGETASSWLELSSMLLDV